MKIHGVVFEGKVLRSFRLADSFPCLKFEYTIINSWIPLIEISQFAVRSSQSCPVIITD